MSTYQYYEFRTINRHLSRAEQEDIGGWSSRAVVRADSASFTYHYGDFKRNPETCLLAYFDMMLYISNYGNRRLLFRFPEKSVDFKAMKAYIWHNDDDYEHSLHIYKKNGFVVVDIDESLEEGYDGWVEGEGILSSLTPIWTDILRGNYAGLYAVWVHFAAIYQEIMAENGDEDDDSIELFEPPVPAGLAKPSAALTALMDFWDISDSLLEAAAQESTADPEIPIETLEQVIDRLSSKEKNEFLTRLLHQEPLLHTELLKRLHALAGTSPVQANATRRSIVALRQAESVVAAERIEREARAAAEKRRLELESMKKNEKAVWNTVYANLQSKSSAGYKKAVESLKDLRDLADYCKERAAFDRKLSDIRDTFGGSKAFVSKLKEAGL